MVSGVHVLERVDMDVDMDDLLHPQDSVAAMLLRPPWFSTINIREDVGLVGQSNGHALVVCAVAAGIDRAATVVQGHIRDIVDLFAAAPEGKGTDNNGKQENDRCQSSTSHKASVKVSMSFRSGLILTYIYIFVHRLVFKPFFEFSCFALHTIGFSNVFLTLVGEEIIMQCVF
jgi:hypothetical protein